jgi:endoglucanase
MGRERRKGRVGTLVLAAMLTLVAIVPANALAGGQNPGANAPNPLVGQRWWDQNTQWNPTWKGYRSLVSRGRKADAAKVLRLAESPQFKWFGMWEQPVGYKLRGMFEQAGDQVPLLAIFGDAHACGGDKTGGGLAQNAKYRRWIDHVAAGIGSNEVVIAFEPDSLGTVDCLAKSRRKSRLDNMRYGIDVLSKLPNVTLYIEAGASDWEPAKRTASQLRYVGIAKVRGFMLNVTHFDWTADNVKHGLEISRMTGGKPFIVNTSSNGRGAVHVRKWINRSKHLWRTINVWCHPGLRGTGPVPTTATGYPKVDAYMWINRPGYSDGSCNGGPLPVGTWWPDRALMFAQFGTSWLRPPAGTSNGHYKRYSLRKLGYQPR